MDNGNKDKNKIIIKKLIPENHNMEKIKKLVKTKNGKDVVEGIINALREISKNLEQKVKEIYYNTY